MFVRDEIFPHCALVHEATLVRETRLAASLQNNLFSYEFCYYSCVTLYYANFMNAVLEKIHAVGTDTWVNFTSFPPNVLQAPHSLN